MHLQRLISLLWPRTLQQEIELLVLLVVCTLKLKYILSVVAAEILYKEFLHIYGLGLSKDLRIIW